MRGSESPAADQSPSLQSPILTPSNRNSPKFLDDPEKELEKFRAELAARPGSLFFHFHPPSFAAHDQLREKQKLEADGGAVFYEWRCIYCDAVVSVRNRQQHKGHGGLTGHVAACTKNPSNKDRQLTLRNVGVGHEHRELDLATLRVDCVFFVADGNRSFSSLEDSGLKRLIGNQWPALANNLSERKMVSRDAEKIYPVAAQCVSKELRSAKSAIHLGCDGWTSPFNTHFLGVTATFVDKDNCYKSIVLGFEEMRGGQSGDAMAEVINKVATAFNIRDRILGIVTDNASANDTMLESLQHFEGYELFRGRHSHSRCFAHILNLIVMGMLRSIYNCSFDEAGGTLNLETIQMDEVETHTAQDSTEVADAADESDGEDFDDTDDEMPDEEVHRAIADDTTADDVESVDNFHRDCGLFIAKIRYMAKKIKYTLSEKLAWPQALEDTKGTLTQSGVLYIPLDVKTRWNSLYKMTEAAIRLQPMIMRYYDFARSFDRNNRCHPREFNTFKPLLDILKKIKDLTLKFSTGRTVPSVAVVIEEMDRLDEFLTDRALNPRIPQSLKNGIVKAKNINIKYYQKTDDHELYSIALLLNPFCRVEYLKYMNWESGWIDNAIHKARELFMAHYFQDEVEIIDGKEKNEHATDNSKNVSPLDWWLTEPEDFTGLRQMAIDYMSMPASSVEVERSFSVAGFMMNKRRGRLASNSSRNMLTLGSWSKRGLLNYEELKGVVKPRKRRSDCSNVPEHSSKRARLDSIPE